MLDIQKTIKEKHGDLFVSSRDIAKVFGRQHKVVLNSIQSTSQFLDEDFRRNNIMPSSYKNSQKKDMPEYLLTRAGFSVVALGFTGEAAIKFRQRYVQAFEAMEAKLKSRMMAKMEYRELTDAIKNSKEVIKPFDYSNEANMINKIVLGLNAKQFRIQNHLTNKEILRDYLTAQEILCIEKLQKYDTILIEQRLTYQERKEILSSYYSTITQQQALEKGEE